MFGDEFALVTTTFKTIMVGYTTGPGYTGDCSNGPCTSSTSLETVYATVGFVSYGDNGGNPSWWDTFASSFLHGVLHGERQPGESFTACVFRNANEATFGGHKALIGAVAATAAAATASKVGLNTPDGPRTVTGAANVALWVGRMVYTGSGGYISGTAVIRPVGTAIGAAGRYGAPVAAAAEAGLLAGSGLNCR